MICSSEEEEDIGTRYDKVNILGNKHLIKVQWHNLKNGVVSIRSQPCLGDGGGSALMSDDSDEINHQCQSWTR